MEEFTAPKTGNYKLECWGSQGGIRLVEAGVFPGLGGYSTGNYSMSQNNKIYICVGNHGVYGSYSYNNNRGINLRMGMPGGGATDITTTNRGELKNFSSYQNEILIVAGGGGSCDFNSGITGYGGHGGGENGTSGSSSYSTNGTGALQSSGGISSGNTASVNGSFGLGGVGWGGSDYGAQGGSGWYGGGGSGSAGTSGGGSGYIGGVQNGKTIAGNAVMPSPDGGTETGHTGDGVCIIAWIL